MKPDSQLKVLNPLYVLVTGSLGIFIAFLVFLYRYPDPADKVGQIFVSRPEFITWVFLHAIHSCVLTIFLIPMWRVLVRLFQDQTQAETRAVKRKLFLYLIVVASILAVLVFGILSVLVKVHYSLFDPTPYVPRGHENRVTFVYFYTFLVALPGQLSIMLIYMAAQKLLAKVEVPQTTKEALLSFRDELLSYRALLQSILLVLGLILSMVSITTAGLRAVYVGLNAPEIDRFPSMHAVLFGVVFSILLLLVYVPAHTALTETSRKLRDKLCPITSLDTLPADMMQRKHLDELLQTNINIMDNLRNGFITLAPFITSLIASLLGIEINP